MAWQWQVASGRSVTYPKFGCYSKPPNMRGRGLLICWLWTTVKNDRLFHISQVSQISDRPHYLPVILGRIVYHSSRIPLRNDRYNVIYEVTFPPSLHAHLRSLSPKKNPSEQLFAHEAPTAPYGTYIQLLSRKLSLIHIGWFPLIFPAHYPLAAGSSNYTTNEPPPALSNRIMDGRLEIQKLGNKLLRPPLRFWASVCRSSPTSTISHKGRLGDFTHAYALDPRFSVLTVSSTGSNIVPASLEVLAAHVLF